MLLVTNHSDKNNKDKNIDLEKAIKKHVNHTRNLIGNFDEAKKNVDDNGEEKIGDNENI